MNSVEQQEIKSLLLNARTMLNQNNLNQEERERLETVIALLSGRLLSVWLPVEWSRRTLMLIIFVVGLIGIFTGLHILILSWLVLPLFSPRLAGELAFAFGNLGRKQQ